MVTIQQHGPNGQLFDFNAFMVDIAIFRQIEIWKIQVEECLGDGASEIEAISFPQAAILERQTLEAMYKHIYQTIDGEFIGLKGGKEYCRLLAVDSSYWEISGTPELENEMLEKYGAYRYGA